MRLELSGLWQGMVYLLAEELNGLRTFRRCAGCGKWLEETLRMDADPENTSCSDACRARLYRRRKTGA